MNMTEAAVWVDVLRASPDRALIAADWFDERGREDIGAFLRSRDWSELDARLATPHRAYDASRSHGAWLNSRCVLLPMPVGDGLVLHFLGLDAQVRHAAAELTARHPLELLAKVPDLRVKADESVQILPRPAAYHDGAPYHYGRARIPHGYPGVVEDSSVLMKPHKFGGWVEWAGQRQAWWFWMWAGRADDGQLYATHCPEGMGVVKGEPYQVG